MRKALGNSASFNGKELFSGHRKATSTLGHIRDDQQVNVCGYDLTEELVPNLDLCQNLYLFIKRKIPSKKVSELLKCLVISVNFPDIRVWPIGAVAYAAAAGAGCGAAVSAGLLGIEARLFGVYAGEGAYVFLEKAEKAVSTGETLQDFLKNYLKEGKIAFGYGHPLFKRDVRIEAVLKSARKAGLDDGAWVKLAFSIEKILKQEKGLILNFAGLMAALVKDLGFTKEEFNIFQTFLPMINYLGVYHEHSKGTSPIFPLACADIDYSGPLPE